MILLVWLAVWLLVFTLPSQRSARYVIPAMPALAMLIALYWDRIARGWFLASLLLCSVFVGVMGRMAWAAHDLGIGHATDLYASLMATGVGAVLLLGGFARPPWTRACTVASCLTFYASFGLTTAPLNGAAGHYSDQTVRAIQGARIAVPSSFNGQFERFQFQLPGNQFVAYDGEKPGWIRRCSQRPGTGPLVRDARRRGLVAIQIHWNCSRLACPIARCWATAGKSKVATKVVKSPLPTSGTRSAGCSGLNGWCAAQAPCPPSADQQRPFEPHPQPRVNKGIPHSVGQRVTPKSASTKAGTANASTLG